jgi:RecA-family ATPase
MEKFVKKLEKHGMVYSGMENGQNDNTNWLIKGVLAKGWNMMVCGSAGSGKSVFIMDMCMHLLSGKTWLGYPVTPIKRVLMLQSENPSDILLNRLRKTSHHCQLSEKEFTKRFIISRRDKRFNITTHASGGVKMHQNRRDKNVWVF